MAPKIAKSKNISNKQVNKPAEKSSSPISKEKAKEKKDFWGNLGNMVKKAVDCCLE